MLALLPSRSCLGLGCALQILVADCVYVPSLYQLLRASIAALSGPGTEVLVAFEQRRRDVSPFFTLYDGSPRDGFLEGGGSSEGGGASGGSAAGGPSDLGGGQDLAHGGNAGVLASAAPRGALLSEHAPGSDGRGPRGAANGDAASGHLSSSPLPPPPPLSTSRVEFLRSPLLTRARASAKVHLARITGTASAPEAPFL